ncbi:NADH:flavin oxidoreductase/NADH oxidase [Glycomyces xiaoerkulensis]|uniref:NADH:flavin oxidoreductase/NADH oxidase n=1 Tax=Glycomyces xiaoerkulensis TaxID=2038139 RepID=UPI000C268E47|nr:NADH:flavin oxidoreductase/NADH oxidase [Glycomyces xiaoerkulensis]
MDSNLFTPLALRGTVIPNRVWMAPMCQYSAATEGPRTGAPNDWHVQHYGSRAVGGPGLILVEATGVVPEGRISPADLGIWNDEQVAGHRRLTDFMRSQGVVPGIQLAHAGRKAATDVEFHGGRPLADDEGGWEPVGPSTIAFDERHRTPHEMSADEIRGAVDAFARAARRAVEAGYEVVEVHAAHGYLVHEFLSPVSNRRDDAYGGAFEGRTRLLREIVDAVREAIGPDRPLLVRVSATDWIEPDGWTGDDTVRLAAELTARGVDLLHVSSGGNLTGAAIPTGPGYQVPFAARVRRETGLPTVAVGMITEAEQAEKILANGEADAVALGRELLRNPHWPRQAARSLGAEHPLPAQYRRADR